MTVPLFPAPATDPDTLALDAALWRAYRHLSDHWLHAFRGSLNGISLNVMLLGSAGAEAAAERSAVTTQLRELDAALTRLLDHSALDEARERCSDVVTMLARVRALVEPLARRNQISVELSSLARGPMADIDARVLHAVLVPTVVDALLCAPARSTLSLLVEDDPSGVLRIDVRADRDAGNALLGSGFRDAARRVIRLWGGDCRDVPGHPAALSLFLRRSPSSTT